MFITEGINNKLFVGGLGTTETSQGKCRVSYYKWLCFRGKGKIKASWKDVLFPFLNTFIILFCPSKLACITSKIQKNQDNT